MARDRRPSFPIRARSAALALGLPLVLLAQVGCSTGKMGSWDPTEARQCMKQHSGLVVATSAVGDEHTLQFLLPSGARVEVSFPARTTDGSRVVQILKWLTPDPSADDRALVDACFPTD